MRAIPATSKTIYIIWFPMFIASMVLSIVGVAINNLILIEIFKTAFIPLLAFITYMKWTGPLTREYYFLQLALLCAWAGDIIMIFNKIHLTYFIAGALMFLVQHVLFIMINLQSRRKDVVIWKAPYWGLPHIGYVFAFSIVYFCKMDFVLKSIVTLYAFFLGSSFLTSFHREINNKIKRWVMIMGFLSFLISDSLIVIDKFLLPMTDVTSTSILVTYYVAQTCICYGNLPNSA